MEAIDNAVENAKQQGQEASKARQQKIEKKKKLFNELISE